MKKNKSNTQATAKLNEDPAQGRTEVEGQNPKANDAPYQDLYHDENRRNMYDPKVGKALKVTDTHSHKSK